MEGRPRRIEWAGIAAMITAVVALLAFATDLFGIGNSNNPVPTATAVPTSTATETPPGPVPTVAVLDPIPVDGELDGVAAEEFVWVATNQSNGRGSVARIDPERLTAEPPIPLGVGEVDSVAVGGGSVWVTFETRGRVARLDANSLDVQERIDVGGQLKGIAVEGDSAWVANCLDPGVVRVAPDSQLLTIPVEEGRPRSVAVGNGRVYVAVRSSYPGCPRGDPRPDRPGRVLVIDLRKQRPRPHQLPVAVEDPTDIVLAAEWLWVADRRLPARGELKEGRVLRVDPDNEQETREVTVAPGLTAIAADDAGVWALSRNATTGVGTVTRIDPRKARQVGKPINVADEPQEIAVGNGHVWVTQREGGVTPIKPPA
jgi:DNA-binding beta-propeller fold protein YncE